MCRARGAVYTVRTPPARLGTDSRFGVDQGDDVPRFSSLVLIACLLGVLLSGPASRPVVAAQDAAGPATTAIAFQPFQRGFMLWREDTGQVTVAFSDLKTKTGGACQEVYRDTFRGQPYEIPPAPPGLLVPELGFGWLYAGDQQLARRLGYATSAEVSRVADVTTVPVEGGQVLQLALSEPIEGVPNPLVLSATDEPGLTYCFARGSENRAVLNTWVAVQEFEYGLMLWRQDRPDRIEVGHLDTELAPEIGCLDTFRDDWRPGQVLAYGDLAIPGRRLPERGFGKIWLETRYVRESLGYPVEPETGGFAGISYEPFKHPKRGDILIRTMKLRLADGTEHTSRTSIEGARSIQDEAGLSQWCSRILIPHQPR